MHHVGGTAADRALEQHVATEAHLVVDDERDAVVGVARKRDRSDDEPAGDEVTGDNRDPEELAELVLMLDVIRVRMRSQQVRGRQVLAGHDLEQWLERRPAVDENGRSLRRVTDHVGIGQPSRMHRPTDNHRYTLRNCDQPG